MARKKNVMPLLYESVTSGIGKAELFSVAFEAEGCLDKETILRELESYDWRSQGLNLLDVKIKRTCPTVRGILVLESLHKSFVAWVLVVPAVMTAITAIGGVLKIWLAKEILDPWVRPGPLGLPVIFWVIVGAGAVFIPIIILMKRK